MFYIHQNICISAQQTFQNIDLNILNDVEEGKLKVKETRYEGIAPALLRRMGKAVRIGVGAGLPIAIENPNGIIIGTANGGMEDCIKFLDQIVEYDEGMLTPGNFVQSTNNAVAGQLGMMSRNTGYNITHVHRAFAFENAIMDVDMLLKENPSNRYLLGAVDEISSANYNIEILDGSYKKESISNKELYNSASAGSIAGEGAVMFLANMSPQNAIACFDAVHFFQTSDVNIVVAQLHHFLEKYLQSDESIDLLLSGENGDVRLKQFYTAVENKLPQNTRIARFKHMCGEYPTAIAFACWLSSHILQQQLIPQHAIKKNLPSDKVRKILIYNNYKGLQHSFVLMSC